MASCVWLQSFNPLRPRQNGRHFADDMFKCLFEYENVWIPIEISLKFVPNGSINNNLALLQIMAWRRPGDKPLSERWLVHWRIYASLGLNDQLFAKHSDQITSIIHIILVTNYNVTWISEMADILSSIDRWLICTSGDIDIITHFTSGLTSKTSANFSIDVTCRLCNMYVGGHAHSVSLG